MKSCEKKSLGVAKPCRKSGRRRSKFFARRSLSRGEKRRSKPMFISKTDSWACSIQFLCNSVLHFVVFWRAKTAFFQDKLTKNRDLGGFAQAAGCQPREKKLMKTYIYIFIKSNIVVVSKKKISTEYFLPFHYTWMLHDDMATIKNRPAVTPKCSQNT